MTPQQVVWYIGIAAFVVAVALAIWSIYTFFSLDILNVMADLSGRKRSSESGTMGRRTRLVGGSRSRRYSDATQEADQGSAFDAQLDDAEANIDTVVDTMLRPVSSHDEIVSSDIKPVIDYNTDDALDPRFYHRNDGDSSLIDADVPTETAGDEDAPTEVADVRFADSFRITRRIVFVHSGEVIVAG